MVGACKKNEAPPEQLPGNYVEMFNALNLQFNTTYKYVERINNFETGRNGTIRFSLSDTSMVENFNGKITKDYFRLDSMKTYSAIFVNHGEKKYNVNESLFINTARETISFVNGNSMVSFGVTVNGSYYFYQYLFSK